MVGIHSTLGTFLHNSLHFEGRAAPNLGIYNRVCHREAQAKRGFKLASLFINGCLGLQVIVAAALTAMGAANTNHVGITAFGAINTVIAGILTYLKGSGLPNRIRWAECEWKKIREFIEQRERDFSRPDCKLNLHEVVHAIEAMYEEVKADVQHNTPDAYVSMSDIRSRGVQSQAPRFQNMVQGAQHHGQTKLQELELKYGHKLTDFLESMAHKEEERLRKLEAGFDAARGKVVQAGQTAAQEARDWEKEMAEKSMRAAERELEHARGGLSQRRNDFERSVAGTTADALQAGTAWHRDMQEKGLQMAEREMAHARGDIDKARRDLERGVQHAHDDVVQLGRSAGAEAEAHAARVAGAARDLELEAQRAREEAERAREGVQSAAVGMRGAAESIQRIGEAVREELPPPQEKRG